MSGKLSSILMVVGVFSVLLVAGCGPSADLSLRFSPDRSTAYKATTETVKLFRFDQPNLGKLKEEQNKERVEMGFTQTIQSVDANGNATAKITIDELKIDIITKNEPQFSFDSQNEKYKNAPMAKLLGQSYTIEIAPDGQVKALDTKAAIAAVKSGYEKKLVNTMLDPKAIADRHQAVLPKDQKGKLTVDSTWSTVVPSPPGMFAPKSYEKTYTLTAVDGTVAKVQMVGTESAEPAEDVQQSMVNPFAKMFDNVDDYTGTLTIDLATGEVLDSEETLVSTSLMQEMPRNGNPDKGPDTLTMKFTHRIQLERLD